MTPEGATTVNPGFNAVIGPDVDRDGLVPCVSASTDDASADPVESVGVLEVEQTLEPLCLQSVLLGLRNEFGELSIALAQSRDRRVGGGGVVDGLRHV